MFPYCHPTCPWEYLKQMFSDVKQGFVKEVRKCSTVFCNSRALCLNTNSHVSSIYEFVKNGSALSEAYVTGQGPFCLIPWGNLYTDISFDSRETGQTRENDSKDSNEKAMGF